MIPLTKEAREGLTKMVAVADCGKPGLRDPKMTAAMAWVESLPDGPIETVIIQLETYGCRNCCLRTRATMDDLAICLPLSRGLGKELTRVALDGRPAPDTCRLRSGSVLVVGAIL